MIIDIRQNSLMTSQSLRPQIVPVPLTCPLQAASSLPLLAPCKQTSCDSQNTVSRYGQTCNGGGYIVHYSRQSMAAWYDLTPSFHPIFSAWSPLRLAPTTTACPSMRSWLEPGHTHPGCGQMPYTSDSTDLGCRRPEK